MTTGGGDVDLALEHLLAKETDPGSPRPRTAVPCPDWCEEGVGHPFEWHNEAEGGGDAMVRFHTRTIYETSAGVTVRVISLEALLPSQVRWHPARVALDAQGGYAPEDAQQIAQHLLVASAEVERLNADVVGEADT